MSFPAYLSEKIVLISNFMSTIFIELINGLLYIDNKITLFSSVSVIHEQTKEVTFTNHF